MAKRFGIDVKVVRLLLNAGLLCVQRKCFDDAKQIFQAVKAHSPDLPHPGVFLGLADFAQGHLVQAEQQLTASLADFPADQLGKAFLGAVYQQRGRSGWQRMLREVIEDGRDEAAIRFARSQLELAGVADSSVCEAVPHVQRVYV